MAVDSRTMALIPYVNSYRRSVGQENSKDFLLLQQVGNSQHVPSSWDHQPGRSRAAVRSLPAGRLASRDETPSMFICQARA